MPGVVTGEELAAMKLPAFVIFSACESSAGIPQSGQGLASLQKAAHIGGARVVVTTLWPVPEESATLFMKCFYHALLSEQMSPSDALTAAKRELRQRRVPLPYWAGWVLSEG